MKKIECLRAAVELLDEEDLVLADMLNVSTELHAAGDREGNMYLLQMGIPFAFGLGLSSALPTRRVIALQGDGSTLLNPGVLIEIAHKAPGNLTCIVFENGRYDAVGHPTPAQQASIAGLARESGIDNVASVHTVEEFIDALKEMFDSDKPGVIVAHVDPGNAGVEPLKLYSEVESTIRVTRFIERTEGIEIAGANTSAKKFMAEPVG